MCGRIWSRWLRQGWGAISFTLPSKNETTSNESARFVGERRKRAQVGHHGRHVTGRQLTGGIAGHLVHRLVRRVTVRGSTGQQEFLQFLVAPLLKPGRCQIRCTLVVGSL